jgi:hypothetical protein
MQGGREEEMKSRINVEGLGLGAALPTTFRRIPTFAGFAAAASRACCRSSSIVPYPYSLNTLHPPHISHHAVQTLLARRFGNYTSTVLTRPLQSTANTHRAQALLRSSVANPSIAARSTPDPYHMSAREKAPIDPRSRLRHHQHRHLQADQVRWQVHSHPYPRYATRKKKSQSTNRQGHRLRLYDHR